MPNAVKQEFVLAPVRVKRDGSMSTPEKQGSRVFVPKESNPETDVASSIYVSRVVPGINSAKVVSVTIEVVA